MMNRRALLFASFVAALAACSDDPTPAAPVDSGQVPETGLPESGAPDGGADAAPADAAPATDGAVLPHGFSLAAGDTVSKSANYRMSWSLGAAYGVNTASTSTKYRMTFKPLKVRE